MTENNLIRVSSIPALPTHYRDFTTLSGWRWILFNRASNGFDKCVIKQGRRVYVDLDLVNQWLDAHREVAQNG